MDQFLRAAPTSDISQHSIPSRLVGALSLLALTALPVIFLIALERTVETRALRRGDAVPPFRLKDAASREISFDQLAGKKLAILFFSPDCPHCRNEISRFKQLHAQFSNQVVFLAVSLTDTQRTRAFVKANELPMEVLIDERNQMAKSFGVGTLPELFFVRASGVLEHRVAGELSIEREVGAMKRLVTESAQ